LTLDELKSQFIGHHEDVVVENRDLIGEFTHIKDTNGVDCLIAARLVEGDLVESSVVLIIDDGHFKGEGLFVLSDLDGVSS
jgi:hypothetical protein